MSDTISQLLSIVTARGERIVDPFSKLRLQEKKLFDEGVKKADELVFRLIEGRRRSGARIIIVDPGKPDF